MRIYREVKLLTTKLVCSLGTLLIILIWLCLGCQDELVLTIDGECEPYREQFEEALGYHETKLRWEKKNVCRYDGTIRQSIDTPCLFCAVAADWENSGPDTMLGGANTDGDIVIFVDRWSNMTPLVFHEVAHYCGYPYDHPNSEPHDWLYAWLDPETDEPTENDLRNLAKYCY